MILQIFFGVGFRQRAAEYREILTEDKGDAAINRAIAGHHAVAGDRSVGHTKIGAAMFDKHIPFFEAAWIEQNFDTFASAELAPLVLRVDAALASAQAGAGAFLF
jgi:hypothetical protein